MKILKDSNVAWIGKIPSDWTLLRIKHTSWLKGRIGWDGLKSSEFTNEGPFLITGTDFTNGVVNWNTCVHITEERFNEDMLLHVKEGDLLITKDGTVGKVAIVNNCPEKVSLNSGIMIIRNITKFKYEDKFLYYVLMSNVFTEWFNYNTKPGTTILHLYQGDFYNFRFMLPNLTEQQQIVSYLDAKCDAIDKAIAHKRSVIEKLKEYRTAVITKAVTKGLNPKVEMKDSDISWIGKVPKDWEISKIKYNISLIGSGATPKSSEVRYYIGNIPWIQSGDIYDKKIINNTEKNVSLEAIEEISALKFYKKDYIVIAMYGASIGNTAISEIDACTNQACCVIKPDNRSDIKYLLYWLKQYKKVFELSSEGGTQPNISQEKIKKAIYLRPNLNEQRQIVAYLDDKCSKIDTAIQQQEQIVAKLEEYRKSFIYYAVTGKIDCGKAV